MPSNIAQLAMQTGAGIAGQAMGLVLAKHNDRRQLKQQGKLQALQIAGNKEMSDYQKQKELEMWEATNYGAQMGQLNKAGLNPGLMYGMSGGGGVTTGGTGMGVSGGNAPQGGREVQEMGAMGIQTAMQLALQKAQKENIEADTAAKKAGIPKTGAEVSNINADTENKILAQVLNKYTGLEAKDQYERIKSPNRGVEAKTYEDEMSARQGVAGTIYELWVEGKLGEKANSEIQALALANAKTTEETERIKNEVKILDEKLKGEKMENIMKELEMKLQTQTGIDRNSPTWMKILGRLFVTLFNK